MRNILACVLLLTPPAFADEPTTRSHFSLAVAGSLFIASPQASIEAQAHSLGFDSLEPSIFGLSQIGTTRPAPATDPSLVDGLSLLYRIRTQRYASLNVGTLTTLGDDDPTKVDSAIFLEMASQFHATMVLPLSREIVAGPNRDSAIKRLQRLGKLAVSKHANAVLDIPLGVDEVNALIDAVGSPAIRWAFDPIKLSATRNDACQAVHAIGAARIGQVRITCPADATLQEGPVHLPMLKNALDDSGWSGWIVMQPEEGKTLSADRLKMDSTYLHSIFATH